MTITASIIHCQVDQEPKTFHDRDMADDTISFAVNLSFECVADSHGSPDVDEHETHGLTRDFLSRIRESTLVLYRRFDLTSAGFYKLEKLDDTADIIEDDAATPDPLQIDDWLTAQAPGSEHFWAPLATGLDSETPVEVDFAGAGHRLRAAQSWDAPVGHQFGLTRIAQIEKKLFSDMTIVVVPYFDGALPQDDIIAYPSPDNPSSTGSGSEPRITFDYDPKGDGSSTTCRTAPIPMQIPPMTCEDFDAGLTPDGYLKVNPDADQVRRITTWLEERATSLLASNLALGPRATETATQEALFGFRTGAGGYLWDGAVWYLVARLISALDPFVIALLKPGQEESEGELLAPLISLIRSDDGPHAGIEMQPADVAKAIRSAFSAHSPLANPKENNARLSRALEKIYEISRPRMDASGPLPITEDSDLVSELLWYFRGDDKDGAPYVPPQPGQFLTQPHHKIYADANKSTLAQSVTRAASALEQGLQSEADAERAILRVIETIEVPAQDMAHNWVGGMLAARIAAAYVAVIQNTDPDLLQAIEVKIEAAWAQYRILLDGPFNGAEAVRRAAGACLVKAALQDAVSTGGYLPSASDIVTALKSSGYFKERFFPTTPPQPAMQLLQQPLARVDMAWLAQSALLDPHLTEVFEETVVEPATASLESPRFIPDQFPAPLTIQIAANIDGSQADAFARNFNGIAVAIRRLDTGRDDWAHAHLADLCWNWPNVVQPPPKVTGALHTMLPAVSDGRGPMFIAYEGFPFADQVLADRMADNGDAPLDPRAPFYTHEPHAPQRDPGTGEPLFAPVPRLAYGRYFQTFGFVTSNAGTLPRPLRESRPDWSPWMPKPNFTEPQDLNGDPDPEIVSTVPYQRRTAIAEMSLGDGKTTRLGKSLADVQPLASDYTRAVIVAADGNPGVCDLFKERDGAGSIVVPGKLLNQDSFTWTLADIRWTGTPTQLLVRLFGKSAGPQELALDVPLDLSPGKPGTLSFTLRLDASTYYLDIAADGAAAKPYQISGDLHEYCWLRLELPAVGAAAAMSFLELEGGASRMSGGPLLLLAPEKSGTWKSDLPIADSVPVTTPRVSYLDFERWFANGDNQFPGVGKLLRALLVAYLMRHLDAEIGRLIDRLPDPAVDSVLVDFAMSDDLSKANAFAAARTISLAGLLEDIAAPLPDQADWTVDKLLELLLRPLDQAFRFRIDLAAGAYGLTAPAQLRLGGVVAAKAPAGTVSRLSLSALVRRSHFDDKGNHPSVFDKLLLQYAAWSHTGGLAAFPSAALRVEVMFNGLSKTDRPKAIGLARDMISAGPMRQARAYELTTAAEVPLPYDVRDWRLLAEVDTTTQRWRPTGRPIYSWIDPRKLAGVKTDQRAPDAALPLPFAPDGALAQFEKEAFLNRQDFDAHSVVQRLTPLPARTVLQKHPWDSPTATYSRHRFTLRSRYAGALTTRENREIDAWPANTETVPANWTHRVAMLADTSRILLTRPQLRALIPLTTAPGGESARAPAPPVAAILQEPPFARGGLADRIACEIKTGFNYGFDSSGTVTIADARKEIGPTPYLTYTPFEAETARGMTLIGEGPMGLTFDNVNTQAPAFPNSMISLRPHNMLGSEPALEELFVGVAMRRYIDPAWSTGMQTSEADALQLDAEQTWWIELAIGDTPTNVTFGSPASADPDRLDNPQSLLISQLMGGKIEIQGSVRAIDGVGPENMIAIAHMERTRIDQLFLLHQPIAAGRYSLSVLAKSAAVETREGRGNAPLTLASFEWSAAKPDPDDPAAPEQDSLDIRLRVEGPSASKAWRTIASAPTFLKWTRTNRDFDFVHHVETDKTKDEWVDQPEMVRNLVGELQTDHKAVSVKRDISQQPLWLCSSTFKSRFPSYVHRHIGFITSRYLKELGSPVEIFCRSAVSGEASPLLVEQGGNPAGSGTFQPPEKAIRVVEFETPAAILCNWDLGAVPDRFKAAYFDLVSTGFKPNPDSGTIRLFLRFVGAPARLKLLTSLTLQLWPGEKRPDEHAVPPDPTQYQHGPIDLTPNNAGFALGLFLTLRRSGAATSYAFEILRSTGQREPAAPAATGTLYAVGAPDVGRPGFFLAVKATSSGGHEFWTDVSMLHSPNGLTPEPFNFDWLFSPTRSLTAAESVAASGLNQMVEAQARIIAVSPPIPIVKH